MTRRDEDLGLAATAGAGRKPLPTVAGAAIVEGTNQGVAMSTVIEEVSELVSRIHELCQEEGLRMTIGAGDAPSVMLHGESGVKLAVEQGAEPGEWYSENPRQRSYHIKATITWMALETEAGS